jgi:fructose-bisphosphate aldolase class II
MAKINIGTALNKAFTGTVRAALNDQPELVDPRHYLAPARIAMADTVTAALRILAAGVDSSRTASS